MCLAFWAAADLSLCFCICKKMFSRDVVYILYSSFSYKCIKVLIPFQQKKGGGLSFNSTIPLTKTSEKMVQLILHEYSIL